MEEDIRKTTEQLLNRLKEEESKPKNIYEFETVVPNYILLPLKASTEELINKNKELEKMVELMNEYILKEYISPEICSKHTPEDCYADIYDDEACKKCILDYFRKKAKGE